MDKRIDTTGTASDDEIFDQLRQYADALAARAPQMGKTAGETGNGPVEILKDRNQSGTKRRIPMLVVAAVVITLVGVGIAALVGLADENNKIQSTSDDQTPTTAGVQEQDTEDATEGAKLPLLADPDRWVITEAYPSQTFSGADLGGIWAWRLDDQLFLLIDGYEKDQLVPLPEASVEVGNGHLTMGWVDGGNRLGLQGHGVDAATLKTVAAAIQPTDGGWTLPDAEVLASQPGGRSSPGESVQVGYSPPHSERNG